MYILYFLALIPIIIYAVLYFKNKSVHLYEFLACSAVCLIIAGIYHASLFKYMTDDVEVHSGEIVKATHYPTWVEKYKVAHYKTVYSGSGKNRTSHQVFSHYTTHYRTHPQYWECYTSIKTSHHITEDFYTGICKNFNNENVETEFKSGFYSGDKNIYSSYKKASAFIYPVTKSQAWANRLKCSRTVFSYPSIPDGTKVYEYPVPTNWQVSNRLINEPDISILEFDRLNAKCGQMKKVNVIMINFGENIDSMIAKYQEAKFIGGKKNDIVICYGNKVNGIPSWAYVFSWSENCLVKVNIEALLLSNRVDNSILPLIEREIKLNYLIKDWDKFNYITIYPTTNSIWLYLLLVVLINGGLIYFIIVNEIDKNYEGRRCYRYGY
jgi:hypothetical protein